MNTTPWLNRCHFGDVLPGFRKEWHGPFDNQFPGASVSVVVLVADKDAS